MHLACSGCVWLQARCVGPQVECGRLVSRCIGLHTRRAEAAGRPCGGWVHGAAEWVRQSAGRLRVGCRAGAWGHRLSRLGWCLGTFGCRLGARRLQVGRVGAVVRVLAGCRLVAWGCKLGVCSFRLGAWGCRLGVLGCRPCAWGRRLFAWALRLEASGSRPVAWGHRCAWGCRQSAHAVHMPATRGVCSLAGRVSVRFLGAYGDYTCSACKRCACSTVHMHAACIKQAHVLHIEPVCLERLGLLVDASSLHRRG